MGNTQQTGRLTMNDLIILAVLGGIFFTFMLGNRALFVPDEARYVEIPREMVVTGDYLTPHLNGVKYFKNPPLFYWLEAVSVKRFGIRESTLRVWPALLALMGCLVASVAGARLFGRLTGVLAGTILATSALYYALGRTIIPDMPVSVLISFALLSFLIGTYETPGLKRRLYLWGFYTFSAFAVMTKGLIGVLIPIMVVGAWIALLGEWRMLRTIYLPSGLALFLLIAAPWHIMVGAANPEFFTFYFMHEYFQRSLTLTHGYYQASWFFIPVLFLGLFPWSIFLVQAINHSVPSSWRERHEHRDALFFLLWAGLVLLFFSASHARLVPSILPVLPPLAILLGRYLATSWDGHDFPGIKVGYTVLMLVTILLTAALIFLPDFMPHGEVIQALGNWRLVFAATLVISGALACGLAYFLHFRRAFIITTIMSAILLTGGNAAAPLLDTKSIKGLAVMLKTRLQPGDEVVSYQNYYPDLPLYLEKRITVVDGKGELGFGTRLENTGQWMVDSPLFWKRWKDQARMYMMTDINTYETLRKDRRLALFPLAQDQRNIVVSNRKVEP